MKTESLQQSIDYVLGSPEAKKYIQEFESPPDDFEIFQISASVLNYQNNVIRIFINFRGKVNPENLLEDAIIDVQGTDFSNFRVVNILKYHATP